MLDRYFGLSQHQTTFRREVLAGLTTFLTMAYIIFVQPAILSGSLSGEPTGLDFGAVMTATCLAAALATGIMALYARLPIAQAPGMGENFFFVISLLPAAAAWIDRQVKAGDLAAGSHHALADRPGRDLHLRRALPCALLARRPRDAAGGDQPEHEKRHRRGDRPVHRLHRAEKTRA